MRSISYCRMLSDRPGLQLFVILPLLLLLLLPGTSRASGAVGIRFGWANVADEFFEGSGELGGTNLAGLHLWFDLIPLLEIEVAGEYISEEFSFTEGFFDGIEAAGDGDYEDITLYATGRVKILSLPALPLHIYAGGGLNVHWMDLAIDVDPSSLTLAPGAEQDVRSNRSAYDDELEEAVRKVAGDRSEMGWHAVAGLRLSFSGTGFSVFLEGRYMDGFDEWVPQSNSVYGGFSLGF